MKTSQTLQKWATRLFGAALLAGAITSQAQSTSSSITNNFDTPTSTGGWTYWYDSWGSYNSLILAWDSNYNNGGLPGSGSCLFTNLWPTNANHGQQSQIWGTFADAGGNQYDQSVSIDGTKYDTVTFDVHVNADAPTNSDGNICQLNVGFWTQNYQVHGTTNVNIPTSATNGWYHVVALVNQTDSGLANLATGWALNINCYGGPNQLLTASPGHTFMWIDNIVAHRQKTIAPPPKMLTPIPPGLPGLNLILNNQYDRTSLEYVTQGGLGWLDYSGDTTYYFNISEFPDASIYPNNQAHLFIATPNGASSIDYNTTNLIWLNVQGNADGTATGIYRYKIFEPNANTNMFGTNYTVGPLGTPWAGTLVNLGAATAIGTWGLTFHNLTNVTMFGPGNVSTNFNIDTNVVAQFYDPLNVLFGAQPNNSPPATGQIVVLTEAGISNSIVGSLEDDKFLNDNGMLDTGTWQISAANAADVQLFPNDPGQKIVSWTIPDADFGLETATSVLGPWTALSGSNVVSPITIFAANGANHGVVPSADLGPNLNLFRMVTAKFTKLQVLMPGETAAPGTPSGKTGAPNMQSVSNAFNIIVNSVDANWNPAPYASDLDFIHITSTDGTATLPPDANLIGGTAMFSVTFNSTNTFTVTASDASNPSKTANTGSPTQAQ